MATPSTAQALGLTALRLAPLVLSTANLTFARYSRVFIRAFNAPGVPAEGKWAVMPGWWLDIRYHSLHLIFGTYIPNFALGLLNAYSFTAFGRLAVPSATVSNLSSWAYFLGALASSSHFVLTFWYRLVPLNMQLADAKEPIAKRDIALKKFFQYDYTRSLVASLPAFACFIVAVGSWVSERV